ncbi:helix-turn-helix domain-containing protein [Streptomyces sp. NBC_01803]|uniref:AraC-like ligand-binding domain-containing protein n=1 Tax=Streptomyces sp. NBC_01803 TaxID=2975946 RepID=UPI002DDA9D66|nr:helix-turn-helix domain-containing protein [Streptomyces sp. NBC_01803]WSA47511.1 helix-turn-helix domain-containing protein [Streptomyces sp. NBC_01803]
MLSTASVPEAERVSAWQRAVRHLLAPVRVTPRRTQHAFEGSVAAVDLGYLRVLSVEADPMRLSRDARLVAAAPENRLALAVQASGTALLHQDGRSAVLRPGELALFHLRRPFTLEQRQRFSLHLLRLPEQSLGSAAGGVDRITGRAITPAGGVAALLAPFVTGLVADAARITAPVGDRLAGNAADLLATLVDELAGAGDSDRGNARDHLLPLIRRYIDENLRDPELSPERVAGAHRISVRYLHRLFEAEETTVRKLIQRRRVEECAHELVRRGRAAPTISTVARSWGFQNPAHFSRAFKAVYGHSPRHWRRDAGTTPGRGTGCCHPPESFPSPRGRTGGAAAATHTGAAVDSAKAPGEVAEAGEAV